MVEFNLLPDVKLEYIKARRTKRLVVSVSTIVAGASIAVLILMILYVDVVQKARINDLTNNISGTESQVRSTPNLNKILTIQSQLGYLPTIESQTPIMSRLFTDLTNVIPSNVTISNFSMDLQQDTVSMQGSADTLNTINQFADTLQYATYNNNAQKNLSAFSAIQLTNVGYSAGGNGQAPSASYNITFKFDPNLFSPTNLTPNISVPSKNTTRSILDAPPPLFATNN